jgi:predicted ferric reductase
MHPMRAIMVWAVLASAVAVPLVVAGTSPLLAWRDPIYILGGFAGIVALCLLLFQPLLATGSLPGVMTARSRRLHRWVGAALVVAVVIHVAGLWMTSPPDIIDALTFTAPTPFSAWGVIAMWALFAAALMGVLRRRLRLRPLLWRKVHASLAGLVVIGSAVHALLIEGTMETVSKSVLCLLVLAASAMAVVRLRIFSGPEKPRRGL